MVVSGLAWQANRWARKRSLDALCTFVIAVRRSDGKAKGQNGSSGLLLEMRFAESLCACTFPRPRTRIFGPQERLVGFFESNGVSV